MTRNAIKAQVLEVKAALDKDHHNPDKEHPMSTTRTPRKATWLGVPGSRTWRNWPRSAQPPCSGWNWTPSRP